MKSKLIQNIILLLTTIVIFILLIEIIARIFIFFFPTYICYTHPNPEDVFLCEQMHHLSKSLENNLTLRANQDICAKWDIEIGWVPKPNCKTAKYTTNSNGIRGKKEFDLKKSKVRIVILGDSFTWGENNLDNETYPFYLDELSNGGFDVLNMGVNGYGPDQFYLYFMRDGFKYEPDIVIFGLFFPDIHRTVFKFRYYFKPRFIIENDKLKFDADSSPIPDLKTALQMSSEINEKNRFYSLSFLYVSYTKLTRLVTAYEKETSLTLKIIDQMDKELKKRNIKLIVLLIPEQEMVEKSNTNYYGVVPKITSYLGSKDIDYINLQPIFKKETEMNNQSLYAGHLKPIGNKIIANELFAYLTKKGIT